MATAQTDLAVNSGITLQKRVLTFPEVLAQSVANMAPSAAMALLPLFVFFSALARRAESRPDRIEREDADFVRRVDAGYRELVAAGPERYVVLDGSLPPEELAARVRDSVQRLIPA